MLCLLAYQATVIVPLMILGNTYINALVLQLDFITVKSAILWINSLPGRDIELPIVARAGQDVLLQVSIGKERPLMRTGSLIGSDSPAFRIHQENLLSFNLKAEDISGP
jgi:hypothetical protein